MRERLLHFFEQELAHLRGTGREFLERHSKVAGRFGWTAEEVADPYVTMLMESFAFLSARVQLKLDDEFPRFAQNLLETLYPHHLRPIPSMAMVEFEPAAADGPLAEGPRIPRDSALRSAPVSERGTRCEYRTAHEVQLWPVEVAEVSYRDRDRDELGLPLPPGTRSVVRIRIRSRGQATLASLAEQGLDELVLHLPPAEGIGGRLYGQIVGRGIVPLLADATPGSNRSVRLAAGAVAGTGFDDDESLLPVEGRSFQGFRLLHEYFAMPARFLFVRITGLAAAIRAVEDPATRAVDLVLPADREASGLEHALDAGSVRLFCTPAVNLFPKRLDRLHLRPEVAEHVLVNDRTAHRDFEVHSITSVTGFGGESRADEIDFRPFYQARASERHAVGGYWTMRRSESQMTDRERRRGARRSSTYHGSEVHLSLVDAHEAPLRPDLREIAIQARCTNRDLPLNLMPAGNGASDFDLPAGAPVRAARCLGKPTAPRASAAGGELAWRLVSHVAANHMAIHGETPEIAAATLREILSLYADPDTDIARRRIDGVRAVHTEEVMRRVNRRGPAAFAYGIEVGVTLDETQYDDTGATVFGAVLDRFLSRYAAMNTFTETVVRDTRDREIVRWPARTGRRTIL